MDDKFNCLIIHVVWQTKQRIYNLYNDLYFTGCFLQTCIRRCLNRGQAGSGRTDDNHDSIKKR